MPLKNLLASLDINSRDLSLAIWFGLIFIWLLRSHEVREGLSNVLNALTQRIILLSMTTMLVYLSAFVYLLHRSQIWEIGNLKDTVYWLFGSGLVLFINIDHVREDGYLVKAVIENLKLVIVLEFIVNLYVFNLWLELILVPFLLLLGGMLGLASTNEKYERVRDFLARILGILGFGILIFVGVSIAKDIGEFFSLDNLRDFLIPILLTISLIPFLYLFGIFVLYDWIFNRLEISAVNRRIAAHAKVKTFLAFGLDLSDVRSWSRRMGILKLHDTSDIVNAINQFKSEDR